MAKLFLEQSSWIVALVQAALITGSLILVWLLRLDFSWGDKNLLFGVIPLLVTIRLVTIKLFGLDHGWWQYTGVSEALDIAKAVSLGSIFFWLSIHLFSLNSFPRSVFILEALLTAFLLMGVRIMSRALVESVREDMKGAKRVVLIGAGFGAQLLMRELKRSRSGFRPVGLVDDDPHKRGLKMMGIPVLGSVEELPHLISRYGVNEVLIAVPSATNAQMTRFVDICQKAGIPFKTMPSLRDLMKAPAAITQVREVNLEDLLGREPVRVDLDSVRVAIEGRVLMVTGAAGSIGSEVCSQLLDFKPRLIVCVDQSETGIFLLERALLAKREDIPVKFVVGDFADVPLMESLLTQDSVEVIFHAAAYKHVPVMEQNVRAAIKNNVLGLVRLLDNAERSGCESFILISSDKAVNPTSIMGATKRIGELITAARPNSTLRCVSVRFGNVLGSNGSLIPLLQDQLRKGEPLTITHPEIRRFFMTVQEAVSLVLQAFAIGSHRDILVLDMGSSLKIMDIARTLIRLSGRSEADVELKITGLREGEKFFEELFYPTEKVSATSFPKIKKTNGSKDWQKLKKELDQLQRAVEAQDEMGLRLAIRQIVPEYLPASEPETTFASQDKAANISLPG